MEKDTTCTFSFSFLTGRDHICTSLSFSLPDDCNINDFTHMCTRFAAAVGYTEKCIDEHFIVDDDVFDEFAKDNI